MLTISSGYGLPVGNLVCTEVFVERSHPIRLAEAHVPTEITLTSDTQAVHLYALQEAVWYNIDAAPGPIPSPETDTLVDASDFRPGGILYPGGEKEVRLPGDSIVHRLFLVSAADYVLVMVTILEQAV